MKVTCNKTENCGVAGKCPHAVPHEKVLTCIPGKCLSLKSKAQCLPMDTGLRFEAPTWAHYPMKGLGLNPFSLEDWSMFKEHCE